MAPPIDPSPQAIQGSPSPKSAASTEGNNTILPNRLSFVHAAHNPPPRLTSFFRALFQGPSQALCLPEERVNPSLHWRSPVPWQEETEPIS